MSCKLPKKGLRIAHINICSIRNKLTEIENILSSNNLHILAVSETHLDSTFEDASMMIQGYNVFRNDRNVFGGGVACYIQNHLPVRLRQDLMVQDIEVLWLQVGLKHLKPILIGCFYRTPNVNTLYMDKVCDMLEQVSCTRSEMYFLGDMNVDWNSRGCPLKMRLMNLCASCGLFQAVNRTTRICLMSNGKQVATCIDHIYLNSPDVCSKAISVPIGCSDHNLIVIVRKTKVPKQGSKVIRKRSFKWFDVINADWSEVFLQTDPDKALCAFNDILMRIADNHAPIKKFTVKNVNTPWLDAELKENLKERDQAKSTAGSSNLKSDWQVYRKLRNFVSEMNKKIKKTHFENVLQKASHDCKQLWNKLNYLLKRNSGSTVSYLETGEDFLTKPVDIANHLNNYFIKKVDKLKTTAQRRNDTLGARLIDQIMKDKV